MVPLNAGKITEGRDPLYEQQNFFLAQPREGDKREVSRLDCSIYLFLLTCNSEQRNFLMRYAPALPPLYGLTMFFSLTDELFSSIALATDIHGTKFDEPANPVSSGVSLRPFRF